MTSPSGSGYVVQDCATSQSYYAVINSDLEVGDVFQSTYPTLNTCFSVTNTVTDWEDWNLINLPVGDFYNDCEECLSAQPIFVSRSLMHHFDANAETYTNTWNDLVGDKVGIMSSSQFVVGNDYNYWNIDTDRFSVEPDFGSSSYSGSMSRTVLFWTRLHQPNDAPFTNYQNISFIGRRDLGNGQLVNMNYISGSGLQLGFQGTSWTNPSASIADKEWTMVGYRFSGTNASEFEMIVNNQIYSGSTASVSINTAGSNGYDKIGASEPETNTVFTGSMNVYLQYEDKLSDTEINQLYNYYRSRFV